MSQTLLNSVGLLVLGAGLSFAAARYWFQRNQAVAAAAKIQAEHDKLMNRVMELERDTALVKASVVPITTAFQALLIKELTHFHTPVMDALMVKVGPPNTLTDEEETQLATLLAERAVSLNGRISASEKDAADILPAVMRRARIEQKLIESESVLAVVAVPKD